ncbi:DegT/DnrJ/EryC1/StrS family aminotransferase [Heyndrickxia camelliae]|uniref:Aminotransferase n=1 Tax=Heyndrickxia camelliae TaxID=1707093 RepID=A0A2N3LDH6_9BACI|nr:DegT/DnrJ/EryC1/StrS family aminotransferase [Heyndrickxia camelliae]PKR82659.1 aminotransferase [Heyndrickxia camelliae]
MKKDWILKNKVNVTSPKLPKFELYTRYVKEIWDSKWLTNNGPLHEKFKKELKKYLNVSNTELFTNGHSALEVALKGLELEGEVITTPFTFVSTIHALTNCGLTPVFCDIEEDTFNIDVNKIEDHITSKTCAILAVHVFGIPCNVHKINEIAKKHNLKVIYDAAHAFGVQVGDCSIGEFGDISMFSLHATKVFHSIEGGLLTFKNTELSQKLKALKNFGITSEETIDYVGVNAKMNEFQAAMGLCNLESIEDDISHREDIYNVYSQGFKECKDIYYLPRIEGVKHNFAYYPILLKNNKTRDFLFEKLKEYNVFTRKYFYPLCNNIECYKNESSDTPVAMSISNRILTLPMYSDLSLDEVKHITKIIKHELGENIE